MEDKYSGLKGSEERFARALSGNVERIPVYAGMHDLARHESGHSTEAFYSKPELFVRALLDTHLKYGIDMVTMGYDTYNIEAGALGQGVVFEEGCVPSLQGPIIKDPSDMPLIRTPDFESEGRFPFVNGLNRLFQDLTGLPPIIKFCGPFSLAANLRGIENLIIDIFERPEFAHRLLDAVTHDVIAPWIAYQQRLFPDAKHIWGADALSSPPVISPGMLEEWSLSYIVKLQEICGENVCVPNWVGDACTPDPERMFDYKLRICPEFLQGQDPDVEQLTPERYKRYADAKHIPLVLGVGASFLANAQPEDVYNRTREYCRVGGEGGRFVLYLCGLSAKTPSENIDAALRAIRR